MEDFKEQAALFKALSDPTRLKLLNLLSNQHNPDAICVNALTYILGITQPAVSQHIKVLKSVGLIQGVNDLGHVIEREKADIGVFLTLEKPTRPMVEEAAMKGFYNSPNGRSYPRLQILTIEEILEGKKPDIPPWIAPVPKASNNSKKAEQGPKLL
jgi:DNA-binding transcriptional ArsR family regulator